MTVYVVTAGEYSDYHIEAVFSTHEKAVAYMGGHSERFNDINTFELDSAPAKKFVRQYEHWLTGDGESCNSDESIIEEEKEVSDNGRGSSMTRKLGYNERWSTDAVFYGESYISAEHAKKLAVEERQKYLREHQ